MLSEIARLLGASYASYLFWLACWPRDEFQSLVRFWGSMLPSELPALFLAALGIAAWRGWLGSWQLSAALGGEPSAALATATLLAAAAGVPPLLVMWARNVSSRAVFKAALVQAGLPTPALDAGGIPVDAALVPVSRAERLSDWVSRAASTLTGLPLVLGASGLGVKRGVVFAIVRRAVPAAEVHESHLAAVAADVAGGRFAAAAAEAAAAFEEGAAGVAPVADDAVAPPPHDPRAHSARRRLPLHPALIPLKADVFFPAGVSAPFAARPASSGLPVFVYLHGGAWTLGHRNHHSVPLLAALAQAGFVVFTVNYRLAGKAAYPTQLCDCKRALAWVRSTGAAAYGGDPRFIIVGGESAGGHLATMVGLTANVPAYQAFAGESSFDSSVAGVVNLYGVVDWTDAGGQYGRRLARMAAPPPMPGPAPAEEAAAPAPASPTGPKPVVGIQAFIGARVLQRRWETDRLPFIRGSPIWWLRAGPHLASALAASGILPSSSSSPALPPALADMASPHPVPPIFMVHGTGDTVVPAEDSDLFAAALAARRAEDAEGGGRRPRRAGQAAPAAASTPVIPDVYVRVPYAHHAFNFVASPRAHALSDAVVDWCLALWRAAAPDLPAVSSPAASPAPSGSRRAASRTSKGKVA